MKKSIVGLLVCALSFSVITKAQDNNNVTEATEEDAGLPFDDFNYYIVSMRSEKDPVTDWELANIRNSELIYGVFNIEPSNLETDAGKLLDVLAEPVRQNSAIVSDGIAYVKYNLEGGNIEKGDYITISSELGVGMKASKDGFTVGVALESSNSTEKEGLLKIRVMVRYEKI